MHYFRPYTIYIFIVHHYLNNLWIFKVLFSLVLHFTSANSFFPPYSAICGIHYTGNSQWVNDFSHSSTFWWDRARRRWDVGCFLNQMNTGSHGYAYLPLILSKLAYPALSAISSGTALCNSHLSRGWLLVVSSNVRLSSLRHSQV